MNPRRLDRSEALVTEMLSLRSGGVNGRAGKEKKLQGIDGRSVAEMPLAVRHADRVAATRSADRPSTSRSTRGLR
jgi:hypothetical protein